MFPGNEDNHKVSNKFEIRPDPIKTLVSMATDIIYKVIRGAVNKCAENSHHFYIV